jgi:hypothetical protein
MDNSEEAQLQRLATHGNEALDRYEKGEAGFRWLVSQLKAVVSMAEPIADPEWAAALRQAWGRLEIISAVMYSEKRKVPSAEMQHVIATAVGTLRELLKQQLSRGPSQD